MPESVIYPYALKIKLIDSVAGADTRFLKIPLVVAKPKEGVTSESPDFVNQNDVDTILTITNKTLIANYTDNPNIVQLFNGGLTKILLVVTEDLSNIKNVYKNNLFDFYTLLISKDFTDSEIASLDIGEFEGVEFSSSADLEGFIVEQAGKKNKGVYYQDEANLFYTFGKFLSQISWTNLQYENLLNSDGINNTATAENLFEARASFSLADSQSVNRLSFFAAGGEAIIAPYIMKEITLNLQSETVNWIRLNTPQYTQSDCSLLADYLEAKVLKDYIDRRLIQSGSITITTDGNSNFIASGEIRIPSPTALWRVQANLFNAI